MPLPSPPEPRQRKRWPWITFALSLALIGTFYWRDYAERQAVLQLKNAGLEFETISLPDMARARWYNYPCSSWGELFYNRAVVRENLRSDFDTAPPRQRSLFTLATALSRLNPVGIDVGHLDSSPVVNPHTLHGLPALRWLRLADCRNLRNLEFLGELTALWDLNLDRCNNLKSLDGIERLPNLTRLSLTDCAALENLDAIKGLPNLEAIVLTNCSKLTNLGELRGLSNLKHINVDDCGALENLDGIASLPKIESVFLSGCDKLSPEAIAALTAKLPHAKIFVLREPLFLRKQPPER